jgi:predicted O-linked N-acetylglucosamine transferase (SPINDLY family)
MRSYSQTLRKILQVDDHAPMSRTKRSDKIRLGIASELLKDHPGARYAYEWLSNLPRDDYEFFIYAFHGGVDGLTRKFETLGTFKRLPFTLASFKYSIDVMRADGLDFLMLPDVGMSASSRVLSQYRIAPVQFTSWGHPVTTGSPNIDYFLSSDLVELPDSDKHYTERLIRLPNTSRFIENDDTAAGESAPFDLPGDRVLYGCLQSMYKLLPQYDFVYPKIAKRVPDACFVFIEGDPSYATAILKNRLARAFKQEGLSADRYVRFLPRMTARQYAGLFSAIDVNIDSIGWSGGYTTIESIAADCPVVTLPTEYMRGRHSYAMLKVMGVDELIAMSAPDFIDKLAELGAEPSRRLAVKKKIAQQKHKLYRDRAVIEAFDAFLKNEFSKISSSSLAP